MTRNLICAAVALLIACGAPVGVKREDPRTVHRQLTANVLTTGKPSSWTRNVLRQWNLEERFHDDPAGALATLHAAVAEGRAGDDELFALSELSFLYAEDSGAHSYDLASAVYAWAFLFPGGVTRQEDSFDPRFRLACDIYNRAVAIGFEARDGHRVVLESGSYPLPFGQLDVTVDPAGFVWGDRQLIDFVPTAELRVKGLRNRYRLAGLGTPLAAATRPLEGGWRDDRFVGRNVRVPVTALLRLDDARQGIASGQVTGTMELYAATERESVTIEGRDVPLEIEPTATLASSLSASRFWERELWSFFGRGDAGRPLPTLSARTPHRGGRIPVVFVHGTYSSPGRWANMVNDLESDRRIRENYEFWFFFYDTGNPIALSAGYLRRMLATRVAELNDGTPDPCLGQMIVIGHSQGGLLTKMTAIDSGDQLWRNVSSVPFDKLSLSPEAREMLGHALFVEPLPFVRRVVFMSTPHRGAYMAGNRVAHWVASFIKLPQDAARIMKDAVTSNPQALTFARVGELPTAIDNMTPGNRFIKALAPIPVAPEVHAHSIIAVKTAGPLENAEDGVVRYESAHIEGVDSELIVHSGHSSQESPEGIQEVRRILLLHLQTLADDPTSTCRPVA